MTKVLSQGSSGPEVKEVQDLLNKAGYTPVLKKDGAFGTNTRKAVIWFQSKYELVMDAKVGPQTLTALRQATTVVKPGKVEPDKSAMASPATVRVTGGYVEVAPPPNLSSIQLLETARYIDEIVVHCAATPEGRSYTVPDIRAWHKARGWSDIGYHYVIYLDGRILAGRPIGQVGAGVEGHNTGKIHICYIGGVSADGKAAKDTRTAAQRSSLSWLCLELKKVHKGIRRVKGHNDYTNAKACPSFKVGGDQLGRLI